MRTSGLVLLSVVILVCCSKKANTRFERCLERDKTYQDSTKVVSFPQNSDLKLLVPKDWVELELEDDNIQTLHLADTALYAKSGGTFSITLSTDKIKVDIPEITIALANGSMDKSLSLLKYGETKCYDQKCVWQLTKDGPMYYLIFSFIYDARLRILGATTDYDEDNLDDFFCQVINILTRSYE